VTIKQQIRYRIPLDDWYDHLEIVLSLLSLRTDHMKFDILDSKEYEYQKDMLFREERNGNMNGSNRCGKTRVGSVEGLSVILLPNRSVWCIGAISELARHEWNYIVSDLMWLWDQGLLGIFGIFDKPRIKEHEGKIFLSNGSFCHVKSMLRPSTLEGIALDLIILAELSNPQSNVDWVQHMMLPRLIDYAGSWIAFYTHLQNPDLKCWVEDMIAEGSVHHISGISAYDVPHIDNDELELLKKTMPKDYFNERILGEYVEYVGKVYSEFVDDIHIFDDMNELPSDCTYFAGVDFGEAALHACILTAHSRTTNTYYIIDEVTIKSPSVQLFFEEIKSRLTQWGYNYQTFPLYGDDDAASCILEMRAYGLDNLRPANKKLYKDYWLESIRRINGLFHEGRIKVHSECKTTLRELRNYLWDRKSKKPMDKFNDCLDALRYGIFANLFTSGVSPSDIFDTIKIFESINDSAKSSMLSDETRKKIAWSNKNRATDKEISPKQVGVKTNIRKNNSVAKVLRNQKRRFN